MLSHWLPGEPNPNGSNPKCHISFVQFDSFQARAFLFSQRKLAALPAWGEGALIFQPRLHYTCWLSPQKQAGGLQKQGPLDNAVLTAHRPDQMRSLAFCRLRSTEKVLGPHMPSLRKCCTQRPKLGAAKSQWNFGPNCTKAGLRKPKATNRWLLGPPRRKIPGPSLKPEAPNPNRPTHQPAPA